MKPIEKSLYSYLDEFAQEQPDMRYFFDEERSFTAKQVFDMSKDISNQLSESGIKEGNIVAMRATRSLDSALIFYALQMLGAITVLCDPHNPIEDVIRDSQTGIICDHLITNEGHSMDISSNGYWKVKSSPSVSDLKIGSKEDVIPSFPVDIDIHKPAVIIFTSGSTGKSKAVTLSQYNYINHLYNYYQSGCYEKDDVSQELLPIHHVFGLAVITMALTRRYQVFFPKNTDVDYICQCIEKHKLTRLDTVPSYTYAIARNKEEKGYDLSSLRVGVLGGAPSSKEQFDYIEKTLGLKLLPVYGMSECIGISGAGKTHSAAKRSSTVGQFLPMTEGFILDENGNPLEQGKTGEIAVRCPAVMLGYFGNEEETKEAIDREGRLHTGDLGYVDEENYLHIVGRKKDIIIRNGNNLSSRKIEEGITSLKEVYACTVVGIKDEKCGEVPASLVILEKDSKIEEKELLMKIREVLPKNMVPAKIRIVDEFPCTASGKVNKVKAKEMLE